MSATRWCWITIRDDRLLAFRYVDPSAGPSAKGGAVSDPPTTDEIREAIDRPSRTVRDPDAFGAVAIGAEDALRMGLPKDPPWIGFFEAKPVPPPRGEDARTIIAIVLRDGQPVANARVKLGERFGRELIPLDTKTTDGQGRCQFPLGRMKTIAIVADTADAGSKILDVVSTRDIVEVPIQAFASLSGVVTRGGAPAVGHVTIAPVDGGVLQVEHGTPNGQYHVGRIVPGTYDVEVRGVDPRTHMSAGTPVFERVTLAPGQNLREDFTLIVGTRVAIAARIDSVDHSGSVYLVPGTVAPTTNLELRALLDALGRDKYISANSTSRNATEMTTELLDVVPGDYTLCIEPFDMRGEGHREQAVATTPVHVQGDRIEVRSHVPPLRPRDATPPRAPGPVHPPAPPVPTANPPAPTSPLRAAASNPPAPPRVPAAPPAIPSRVVSPPTAPASTAPASNAPTSVAPSTVSSVAPSSTPSVAPSGPPVAPKKPWWKFW